MFSIHLTVCHKMLIVSTYSCIAKGISIGLHDEVSFCVSFDFLIFKNKPLQFIFSI